MKTTLILISVIMIAVTSGCTVMDGGAVITGEPRNAISAQEVHIYRAAPDNFEKIAIVSASAGHDFKKRSTLMNEAIQKLREEAAKLGANGIILTEIDERDSPKVTTTYSLGKATEKSSNEYAAGNGISVDRGDSFTRLNGVAVYVPK